MSTLDTKIQTYRSTQANKCLFFNAGEKGVSCPTQILATNDSIFATALYGDRLIGENEPILLNDISATFIDCCINNRKIDPSSENTKLLLFRKIIKSLSRKKLRAYLLNSKPESVSALAKIAIKKDLEKLIKTFIKHFQFGLPSVELTKNLIDNPSLFDNLPYQDPPPAFDCDSMNYEEIVEDCTGVDSPTIRLWLHNFHLIAENLISTCKLDCKVYDDNRNYRELTDLFRIADSEASYYKSDLSWQVSQLLITAFAHPEIFSDLHRNCLVMDTKNNLFFYLEDLVMHMPHADYLTRENLHAHYMYFSKKLAEANLILKEANRLGITDTTLINVDVDKTYKSIFGYNRESTLACVPPTSSLNKNIIDIADGYECSNIQNLDTPEYKKAILIINCIKSLPPEHRKLCTRYAVPYIYTLIEKIHNPSLTLHAPPEIIPIAREIKIALTIALL